MVGVRAMLSVGTSMLGSRLIVPVRIHSGCRLDYFWGIYGSVSTLFSTVFCTAQVLDNP